MKIFVVRGKCDHKPDCDEPNEEPLIVLLFAESDPDQEKMIKMIDEAKPMLTDPAMGIVTEGGSEVASIGEAILGILQRFLVWKKMKEDREKKEKAVAAVIEEEDPFSSLKEFDSDKEFGSKG